MIDEEWLSSLEFESPDFGHIRGLAGVGGYLVALNLDTYSGEEKVLKFRRELWYLPCYLRELPLWLTRAPAYDLDRLNRKLAGLVGDPNLHIYVEQYNRLHDRLVGDLVGDTDPRGARLNDALTDPDWMFLCRMPPVLERLSDVSRSDDRHRRAIADKVLAALARLRPTMPLLPERVYDNPLLVWAGAILGGYYSKEQFESAAMAVRNEFSKLGQFDQRLFVAQAGTFFGAIQDLVGGNNVPRLLAFIEVFNASRRATDPQ